MKSDRVIYTDDGGEMDGFDRALALSPEDQIAAGLSSTEEALRMRLVRKAAKDPRINVRLSGETLAGLKASVLSDK